MDALNIEEPEALQTYLRATQRIGSHDTPRITLLPGGVSNRTVRVECPKGDVWVIKQALAKLRVKADWFSDPRRIHREALGLRWLARLTPSGSVPRILFEDPEHHLFGMEAVAAPHENWKTRLLAGGLDLRHVRSFGRLLGCIHEESHARRDELPPEFTDRSFFETLRLEPYYRFSATRNPEAAQFLESLIDATRSIRLALVHGDYSPKNILLRGDQLVLLDHEVIHIGDPAFDLGFALTHLLSKAHHLRTQRDALLDAALQFWYAYRHPAPRVAREADLERRAVRHTLACLLARVDGRSPLEYLTGPERNRQRRVALALMAQPPASLPELVARFRDELRTGGRR